MNSNELAPKLELLDNAPAAAKRSGSGMSARRTKQLLREHVAELAIYLFPKGKREGVHWCIGDITGAPGRSLKICTQGDKAGWWGDFADSNKHSCSLLDLWMRVRKVDFKAALGEAALWLGYSFNGSNAAAIPRAQRALARKDKTKKAFPWQACVDAVAEEHLKRFADWRGYSPAFCSWLHKQRLVGLWQNFLAFPVHDHAGIVIAVHYRTDHNSWRYAPPGAKVRPLVIGEPSAGGKGGDNFSVQAFESQFDAFAVCDKLAIHEDDRTAVVVTRGSSNGALVAGVLPAGAVVYAWKQNDELKNGKRAGDEWLKAVCENAGSETVKLVATPAEFKDVNEWTQAGASVEDLLAAAKDAQVILPSIARLASLPVLEYERQRNKFTAELGCRISALDKLVEEKRLENKTDATMQGSAVSFPKIEPWPEPVDGADVLDQVSCTISRYIVLPEGAADVIALWCAHTHVFNSFICSPRLNISSPDKGCGKTTLRDVAALFVSRAVPTENLTGAVLFRLVDAHAPTILADEYDGWLDNNEELRSLLNAGHRRGGRVLRCEGENNQVRSFAAYSPAALCGIGTLPSTLHDRSITIRLERAKESELPHRFDSRRTECQREQELTRKLVRWCEDNSDQFERAEPVLPQGMFNRLADNWRPLFAVAQVASGDWPERSRAAAEILLKQSEGDEGHPVKTLAAIKQLFQSGTDADRLPTKDILQGLVEIEEGPWADWWERDLKSENSKGPAARLSKLLKPFSIRARVIRMPDGTTLRGYLRQDFEEAWKRYSPPNALSGCNNVTKQTLHE